MALGLALGLASATKLTGLVGLPIVVGMSLVVGALAWQVRPARGCPPPGRLVDAERGGGARLFVVVNPYLWRGPVSGLLGMVEERRDEMAFQQEQWPEFAVLSLSERPWLTMVGSTRVGPWADLPAVAVPLGLGLAALGLATSVQAARRAGFPALSATAMLIAWLAGYTLAILAGLGLSYPRYFLPACVLLLPFVGAGAGALILRAAKLAGASPAQRTPGRQYRNPDRHTTPSEPFDQRG